MDKSEHDPDQFPSTRWSLVARAADVDVVVQQAALAELLPRYISAMRSYLMGVKHLNESDADDVLQGFLASKVLEEALLQRARRERGRFRAFLVTALDHYAISEHRRRNAQKRSPAGVVSLDQAQEAASGELTPPKAFDVAWVKQLLAEAIGRMKGECDAGGRADVWGVFESRVLVDLFEGAQELSYDELVARYGLKSPAHATNILTTGKRMFTRILRTVIAEYEPDPTMIDEEISGLSDILRGEGL